MSTKTSIRIQNLKCEGCAATVTDKLSNLENITDVNVNLPNNEVSFQYKTQEDVTRAKIRLKEIGFPTEEI